MTTLRVEGLSVAYGQRNVLQSLSLTVPAGTCCALLGRSGGGKSTLLSAIAGLVPVQRGRIVLGDEDITHEPPERRHVGMVFQHYALFPSMSALDNLAFGLRQQGKSRRVARDQAMEWTQRLGLEAVSDRYPHQLSGGEQQRVALGRALATRPRLLLMDEPLSSIDPALRQAVRLSLRALRASFGITTVLVTHDREDAFWLADTLGLLRGGQLIQLGTPAAIYRQPVDRDAGELLGPISAVAWSNAAGGPRQALLRPEDVSFQAGAGTGRLSAVVESIVDLGAARRALCRTADGSAVWAGQFPADLTVGATGRLALPEQPWTVAADPEVNAPAGRSPE